jgi:hypothetical protein
MRGRADVQIVKQRGGVIRRMREAAVDGSDNTAENVVTLEDSNFRRAV